MKKLRQPPPIDAIIAYMEATTEESWLTDVVRSKDQSRNCFFGHLFAMGGDDETANYWWALFEETYATTYMIFPVNDGSDPGYPQTTPRQRIVAYLRDLRDGKTPTTQDHMRAMEAEWAAEDDLAASELAKSL